MTRRVRAHLQGLAIAAFSACLFVLASAVASAQDDASDKAQPRHALVVGVGRYAQSPLVNPVNDAEAIAEQLRGFGFAVILKLEPSKKELEEAFDAFGRVLTDRRGVGLFFFAGHGVQLDWRNFLLPVDVKMRTRSDLEAQGVDVSHLLDRLRDAKNAMNVVILDACRNNPFGPLFDPRQKGLSQMDAPAGTLIAYSTAPGNLADDGGGRNSLYTENLLREMQTPSLRIEEVLKRVRQSVRRASGGRQVPWESTSLEDDLYLVPGQHAVTPTEEQLDREYEEDLAMWESVSGAREPSPIEEYLKRFPDGKFSELAMFKLERIQTRQGRPTVQVASSGPTPVSAGTRRVEPYRVGDRFFYREVDPLSGAEKKRFVHVVTKVTDDEVHFNHGKRISDLFGNVLVTPDGRRRTPYQFLVAEYWVGKTWSTRFDVTLPNGRQWHAYYDLRVAARETVTIPAGTFDAFRIEAKGRTSVGADLSITQWVAPEKVNGFIIHERAHRNRRGEFIDRGRIELVAFQPVPR